MTRILTPLLLLIFSWCLPEHGYCQQRTPTDSLALHRLLKSDIQFHSQFEKSVIQRFDSSHTVTMLELMLASDKYMLPSDYEHIKHKLDSFVNVLRHQTKGFSLESKIRFVFQRTHAVYLRKYEENILTGDLFKNGFYNCVTGTCLFAHIFNELNIPYVVKELPNHVFIVADTSHLMIPVESTNPKKGYVKPQSSLMQKYIHYLLDNKLLTAGELDTLGLEATFNKYFYPKTTINYIQLAGLQYHNQGVYEITHRRWHGALTNFKKSAYFNDSERSRYLLMDLIEEYLTDDEVGKDSNTVSHFLTFYYCLPKEEQFNYGIEMFKYLNSIITVTGNNFGLFDYFYKRIFHEISRDTLFANRIKVIYYFEKARIAIRNNNIDSGVKYVFAASFLEPDNQEYIQTAEYALMKKILLLPGATERVSYLNELVRVYPVFKQNKTLKFLYAVNYLEQATTAVNQKQIKDAESVLYLLERNNEYMGIDSAKIADVFTGLSDLYARNDNKPEARRSIDRGLKILPSNEQLLNRKRVFNGLH